jgi:hypothetical protein
LCRPGGFRSLWPRDESIRPRRIGPASDSRSASHCRVGHFLTVNLPPLAEAGFRVARLPTRTFPALFFAGPAGRRAGQERGACEIAVWHRALRIREGGTIRCDGLRYDLALVEPVTLGDDSSWARSQRVALGCGAEWRTWPAAANRAYGGRRSSDQHHRRCVALVVGRLRMLESLRAMPRRLELTGSAASHPIEHSCLKSQRSQVDSSYQRVRVGGNQTRTLAARRNSQRPTDHGSRRQPKPSTHWSRFCGLCTKNATAIPNTKRLSHTSSSRLAQRRPSRASRRRSRTRSCHPIVQSSPAPATRASLYRRRCARARQNCSRSCASSIPPLSPVRKRQIQPPRMLTHSEREIECDPQGSKHT